MRGPIMLPLIAAMLCGLSVVVGRQEAVSAAPQDSQLPAVHRQHSSASRRDEIELEITPMIYSYQVHDQVPTDHYKVGDPISLRMMMLNTTGQNITVFFADEYVQFRPRLVKDGVSAPYRKEIHIPENDKDEFPRNGSLRNYTLLPHIPQQIGSLSLKYWYEPLEAGHYQLTLRQRFGRIRRPIESNTATFEVAP